MLELLFAALGLRFKVELRKDTRCPQGTSERCHFIQWFLCLNST